MFKIIIGATAYIGLDEGMPYDDLQAEATMLFILVESAYHIQQAEIEGDRPLRKNTWCIGHSYR